MDIQLDKSKFGKNSGVNIDTILRRVFLIAMLLGGGRSAFSTAIESR